jgi:hypothetical protein
VQHPDQVGEVLGYAITAEDVEHELTVYRVEGLDMVNVQSPRAQPMLFPLEQGHLEREDFVRASSLPHEAVLVLDAHYREELLEPWRDDQAYHFCDCLE